MTQLARECGISKANIYHYYNGKDALLFDILDTYLSALRERVCDIDMSGLGAEERLTAVISEILMAYQGADHEHQVQVGSMSALPEEQQTLLRGYQRDMVGVVSDAIEAVAPEVFEGEAAKLRGATMSVFGMLNWYYMWNSGAGKEAREDYATLVSRLTLTGVRGL